MLTLGRKASTLSFGASTQLSEAGVKRVLRSLFLASGSFLRPGDPGPAALSQAQFLLGPHDQSIVHHPKEPAHRRHCQPRLCWAWDTVVPRCPLKRQGGSRSWRGSDTPRQGLGLPGQSER